MRSGILREDEGFDLLVDSRVRTFRDEYANALGAARELKARNRKCVIHIRTRANGHTIEMLEDGRIK